MSVRKPACGFSQKYKSISVCLAQLRQALRLLLVMF